MGTVPHLIQLSPGRLLNVNMTEHHLKMIPGLDGQLKQLLMIVTMLSKSWWWAIDDGKSWSGDSHRSGHFIWQCLEYFAWTSAFKQGLCQMGPTFADTCSEVISDGNMFGAVGYLQCNPGQHVSRIITDDETWIQHWDTDTKQESMQWKHVNSLPPRKFRTQPLAGKVMATIFWDCKGVLLVDYLPQKTAMTGP